MVVGILLKKATNQDWIFSYCTGITMLMKGVPFRTEQNFNDDI